MQNEWKKYRCSFSFNRCTIFSKKYYLFPEKKNFRFASLTARDKLVKCITLNDDDDIHYLLFPFLPWKMKFIICFFDFYLKKWNSLFAFFIFTFKSNFITCFFSFLLKKWNKSFCFFLIFSLQNMRNDYWNKFFENLICFFLGNCFSFSHEVDRKCFVKRNLCRRWCII